MEYKIRNYSSYDDDPRFAVRSDTGNISNISDRMVRLAAKITESYAGDIFYDIDTLNRVVESGKNHVLHYYSYENLDDFVQEISPATIERKADGTLDRESPNYIVEWQLIAEMLFETEALYRHLVPGKIWNEYEMAAAYIRKTIGQEEENEED